MDELVRALQGPAVEYAGRALAAVVLLAVGWVALRVLIGPLRRLLERTRVDAAVASFLASSLRGALLAALILAVLQQLGVQTASLLTLLGVTGLALALALQGTLANFAAGLLLLAFRLVRVGDLVEAGDLRGRVTEVQPFHTILVTAENQRVTVPNTFLVNTPVRNLSALPQRQARWTLPLRGADDLAAVKAALRARLLEDPRVVAEPAPQLYVQEWADDRRVLAVEAWAKTADQTAVQRELLEALGASLDAVRIGRAA